MKQLLLSFDLAHVEGIDVSDVIGSSLNEQVKKLLSWMIIVGWVVILRNFCINVMH